MTRLGRNGFDLGYGMRHQNDDDDENDCGSLSDADDHSSVDFDGSSGCGGGGGYAGGIQLGALPTPASETAKVAVKHFSIKFIYLLNVSLF